LINVDAITDGQDASQVFIKVLKDTNQCAVDIVKRYKLQEEVKQVLKYTFSEEWLKIAQHASNDDFNQHLGDAIEPLLRKLTNSNLNGKDFMSSMSLEVRQWIKDTSLVWVKNKGAGSTTTINEVEIEKLKKEHKNEIEEMTNRLKLWEYQKNKEKTDLI